MNTDAIHEHSLQPGRALIAASVQAAIRPVAPAVKPMQFWAFLENSDFVRVKDQLLYRQDEVNLIRHEEFLEVDYQLMVDIGCVGVRDAARWYISHPVPGAYDWTWLDRVVAATEKYRLKQYLDLWHYGYPDWLDILSPDAPMHFADFARQIAKRYPSLEYYCVCNEPSLLVELGGRQGQWSPFLQGEDPAAFRRQVSRMIIEASKAILEIKPDPVLIIPEPWHATDTNPEENQAAVLDTVLGLAGALMHAEGFAPSSVGTFNCYEGMIDFFVQDIRDPVMVNESVRLDTLMTDEEKSVALAREILSLSRHS